MAWTTPLTAVANNALTASQWNASVRDNLNETAVAKATAAGRIFVSTGSNALAERVISEHSITTAQTTGSTAYTDLSTVGPQLSVATGTRMLVAFTAQMQNTSANTSVRAGVDISGATSQSPSDSIDLYIDGLPANQQMRNSCVHLYTGLTSGTQNVKMQYKVGGGTGTFSDRTMVIVGL